MLAVEHANRVGRLGKPEARQLAIALDRRDFLAVLDERDQLLVGVRGRQR